jgi:type IX secretion system PorP/SprF family membrane protein
MRKILLFCLSVGIAMGLQAQDIHYSQFYNSNMNVNPALTGIFNGDKRVSASYRHQWYSVPVPYLTFTGSYDQKFYKGGNAKSFFSGGALFNYDQAADSRLTMAQLSLSASWTYLLNENNLLTVGAQLGGAQRQFSDNNLQWDNQFNGFMFDPMLTSGENFDGQSFLLFNGSLGLNYRWQKDARTKLDLGAAMMNLFSSDASFARDNFNLQPRYSFQLESSLQLTSLFDVVLNGLVQFQGGAREIVPAAILRTYINQKRGKEFALDLGAIARYSFDEWDAIAPKIGFVFPRLQVSLSYDINISDFNQATERYGGPEVHVLYLITEVKPLNSFKTCPIF